jgi:hypothetical protein
MNPSLIDLYLAELRLLLRQKGERTTRFLREVADHLADAVSDSVGRGMPAREAETEAIGSFGAPETIAQQIAPELRDEGTRTTFSALPQVGPRGWLRALREWRPPSSVVATALVPVVIEGGSRVRMRRA